VRVLNVVTSLAFAYITYRIIQIGLGQAEGIGSWFLSLLMVVIVAAVVYFWYQAKKLA
jgi:hypothetical protein